MEARVAGRSKSHLLGGVKMVFLRVSALLGALLTLLGFFLIALDVTPYLMGEADAYELDSSAAICVFLGVIIVVFSAGVLKRRRERDE